MLDEEAIVKPIMLVTASENQTKRTERPGDPDGRKINVPPDTVLTK